MRIGRCLQKVILIWSIKTHLYANWNDSVERENFMIREKGDNYKNKVLKLSKKKKRILSKRDVKGEQRYYHCKQRQGRVWTEPEVRW